MVSQPIIHSVSEVNRYIRNVLSQDENLRFIYVRGEISNFKPGPSGHLYFSLKDQECMISVAMFSNYASKLIFTPKNGDEVILIASVDAYPPRGTYQLVCFEMNQVGQGSILIELEKLKKALQAEGLFDEDRKRSINIYPNAIGVITAKNSAAIRDILTNIKRRYPVADIYVFYASVQGENAPEELLKAFLKSQEYDLDTLIIGRGGGASEDLSAFNDEKLVRAIANSKMPVISAVGHEIDVTLVDYVADKRASTPTGAAEMATVDIREINQRLALAIDDMKEALLNQVNEMKEDVSEAQENLNDALKSKLDYLNNQLAIRREQLIALNPKNILNRGYSITMDSNGNVIDSVANLDKLQKITTVLKDGTITSTIDNVEEENDGK